MVVGGVLGHASYPKPCAVLNNCEGMMYHNYGAGRDLSQPYYGGKEGST